MPEKTFSLDKVEGRVKLTKTVEIPPFCTIQVHGIMEVRDHDKRFNIIVGPKNNGYDPPVVAVPSYAYLKLGSSSVNISLRNLTGRNIKVKAKSIVAQVVTANVVPSILTPKIAQESEENEDKRMKSPDMSSEAQTKTQLTEEQLKKTV